MTTPELTTERLPPLCICYHGTNQAAALAIQRDGFQPGTYFARHLEDAIGFGGDHVFGVVFLTVSLPENWQFCIWETVSASEIISYRVYHRDTVYQNEELRDAVFKSNS